MLQGSLKRKFASSINWENQSEHTTRTTKRNLLRIVQLSKEWCWPSWFFRKEFSLEIQVLIVFIFFNALLEYEASVLGSFQCIHIFYIGLISKRPLLYLYTKYLSQRWVTMAELESSWSYHTWIFSWGGSASTTSFFATVRHLWFQSRTSSWWFNIC